MNQTLVNIGMYSVSYSLVVVISFFLLNFLSNGFFLVFLKVKASRGRKVLVNVHSHLIHYSVPGLVAEGDLLYTDRPSSAFGKATSKRVKINKGCFYRHFGLDCVDVDEDTNHIIMPTGKVESGFDAIKINELYKRALYSAQSGYSNRLLWVVLLGVGVVLVGVVLVYFKVADVSQVVSVSSTVTGGNI